MSARREFTIVLVDRCLGRCQQREQHCQHQSPAHHIAPFRLRPIDDTYKLAGHDVPVLSLSLSFFGLLHFHSTRKKNNNKKSNVG